MSGHSKWSTIKHKKALVDAKRGSSFTKLAKGITIATKEGNSGDPEFNFGLRLAIEKARAANMPKDNIERAIATGLGGGKGGQLEEFVMEGYGPEGVAIILEILTDSRNRSVAEIKTLFDKNGGSLGEPGSVMYLFERAGVVKYEVELDESQQLEMIDLGASEIGEGEVVCTLGAEQKVGEYLKKLSEKPVETLVEYRAMSQIEVADDSGVMQLLDKLEEHDDVQGVYANI